MRDENDTIVCDHCAIADARLIAAAPNMAKFIRELSDMTDIHRALNSGIIRQMQDLLTEAGLTK